MAEPMTEIDLDSVIDRLLEGQFIPSTSYAPHILVQSARQPDEVGAVELARLSWRAAR
jgi:hypothetical protein